MAHAVNVAENAEVFEVYNAEVYDQAPIDPNQVQALLKLELNHRVQTMLNQLLIREADSQLPVGRYERRDGRAGYRNGYYRRGLTTTFGQFDLQVPRARTGALQFKTFAAYRRRWHEVDRIMLEAYIGGMSCRASGQRLGRLLGCSYSGTTVAKLGRMLEEQLQRFKFAVLEDIYEAIIVDGMYVRIKQCGKQKRPVIAVVGVKSDGTIDLLGLKVCYSENSTEVEGLLRSIRDRGVRGTKLQVVTIDGNKGLEAAIYAVYGNVRIQDCVFHRLNRLHQNAASKKNGRRMMQEGAEAFKETNPLNQRKALKLFADKWRQREPTAIKCFEYRLERCFEVNALSAHLRSKASTTNLCEGLFSQLRSRINQIGAFDNPVAVEKFVFAVICQKAWINVPGRISNSPLLNNFTHNY